MFKTNYGAKIGFWYSLGNFTHRPESLSHEGINPQNSSIPINTDLAIWEDSRITFDDFAKLIFL